MLTKEIRRIWRETSPEMREELIEWLADKDSLRATAEISEWPFQWVDFVRILAGEGLRLSVRKSHWDRFREWIKF